MAESKKIKQKSADKERYIEGIGRRKTATARVRIYPGDKGNKVIINEKAVSEYFSLEKQRQAALAPFEIVGVKFKTSVRVSGSGLSAQAEAVRHGLSRALIEHNKEWREKLKPLGYLTRDSRMVERKKPGLRKARRPQQWRKR